MDHDTKQPRKRALRLAGFREKINDDDAPAWRQDTQTLAQDLAAGRLQVAGEVHDPLVRAGTLPPGIQAVPLRYHATVVFAHVKHGRTIGVVRHQRTEGGGRS
jgi:hypothetical protein